MFKRNQIQKTIIAAGVTLISCAAFAQQSANTTASVTVQNAFTVAEVDALSFGTITALYTSGASSASSVTIAPDGAVTADGDDIKVLVDGAPASYTVTGAAGFTNLKARLTASSIKLTNSSAPSSDPKFTVGSFVIQKVGATATSTIDSAAMGSALGTDTVLGTDVNGELAFSLGATMSLPVDQGVDTKALIDGTYSGTYNIELSY